MTKEEFYTLQDLTNKLIDDRNFHVKNNSDKELIKLIDKQIEKNIKLLKKHSK